MNYLKWMNQRKLMIALIIIQAIFIFLLQCLVGYSSDDFIYMKAGSFLEKISYEYEQYMTWTGRTMAHLFTRLMLSFPKMLFNVINTVIYVGITYLMYVHANLTNERRCDLYLITSAFCWLLFPVMGETVFWLTGACNYLWGSFFILLTLLPFRLTFSADNHFKINGIFTIGMCLLSLISGWYNENTSGGYILMMMLYIVWFWYKKITIKPWMILSLLFSIIGFALMYFAPGNDVRMLNTSQTALSFSQRLYTLCQYIDDHWKILLCVVGGLYLLSIFSSTCQLKKALFSLVYLLVALAILFVLVFSPWITKRAYFGAVVFFVIACVSVLSCLQVKIEASKTLLCMALSYMTITFAFSATIESIQILKTRRDYNEQVHLIVTAISNNEKSVVVPHAPRYSEYCKPFGLSGNAKDWRNRYVAQYYGIDEVVEAPSNE